MYSAHAMLPVAYALLAHVALACASSCEPPDCERVVRPQHAPRPRRTENQVTAPRVAAKNDDLPASEGHSRFRVIWDSTWPLQCYTVCHVDTPSLNLSAYSIEANGVNGNGSMSVASGGVLTLWDEDLGLYPTEERPTHGGAGTRGKHGGVPQLAVLNLTAHLAKLTADINEGQPRRNTASWPVQRALLTQ